jgi:hypothetical protein
MARKRLELESLDVTSFTVTPASAPLQLGDGVNFMMAGGGGGFCCTGCVSGCGYNPSASGCESDGGSQYCETMQMNQI